MIQFSIIIPLFNKENYILDTLNSVLAQTYNNFEIIVIDDGSTDSSFEKLLSISDFRIKAIKIENGGVSNARNIGINTSSGNYLCFLDADDVFPDNYLESLKLKIELNPLIDVIVTNWKYGDELALEKLIINNGFKFFFYNKFVSWLSSYCVKKEYLDTNKVYFDTIISIGEDKDFLIKLFLNNPFYSFNNNVLLNYNTNDINSLTRNNKRYKAGIKRTFFSKGYKYIFSNEIYLILFVIKYYRNNINEVVRYLLKK